MAVWQFDFHLISRKKLLTLFGEMPSSLDDEAFNSVESWDDSLLPKDYDAVLGAFLPNTLDGTIEGIPNANVENAVAFTDV